MAHRRELHLPAHVNAVQPRYLSKLPGKRGRTAARTVGTRIGRARKRAIHYGPDNPIGTPPGARTTAIVTPGITCVGGTIASAPSRSAFSNDARVSATCTLKLLPGVSDWLIGRIPPPPLSEYAN